MLCFLVSLSVMLLLCLVFVLRLIWSILRYIKVLGEGLLKHFEIEVSLIKTITRLLENNHFKRRG